MKKYPYPLPFRTSYIASSWIHYVPYCRSIVSSLWIRLWAYHCFMAFTHFCQKGSGRGVVVANASLSSSITPIGKCYQHVKQNQKPINFFYAFPGEKCHDFSYLLNKCSFDIDVLRCLLTREATVSSILNKKSIVLNWYFSFQSISVRRAPGILITKMSFKLLFFLPCCDV